MWTSKFLVCRGSLEPSLKLSVALPISDMLSVGIVGIRGWISIGFVSSIIESP